MPFAPPRTGPRGSWPRACGFSASFAPRWLTTWRPSDSPARATEIKVSSWKDRNPRLLARTRGSTPRSSVRLQPFRNIGRGNILGRREPEVSMSHILVVDDDASHRALICDLLQEMGYQTREASNGREALDLLEETLPQAVLLDLRMPVMNGWGVLEALKEMPRERPIRSSPACAGRAAPPEAAFPR